MPASFPSSAKSFVTREIGDTIAASHINDLQLEVAAIESDLLNATPTFLSTVTSGINATALSTGTVPLARLDANVILTTSTTGINATALSTGTVPLARLASANTTANGIVDTTTQSFAGGKTFSGVMTITGAATLSNTLGVTGATTLSNTLAVTGATTLSSTVATGALTVTGAATVSTTLGVTGATTLSSTVATGALTVTGAATVSTTLGVTGATTLSSATYTTNLTSTTALATPAALTATQATAFASTVSGAAIMGFGTTNDVSLMNRAGTVVLGVGPNTTAVNIPGTLAVTGAVTGGTYNSQTISSAANFTGAVTAAGLLTINGTGSANIATCTSATNNSPYLTWLTDGTERLRLTWSSAAITLTPTGNPLTVAGLLSVTGFGTHSFSAGGAGGNRLQIKNTTAGAGNWAGIDLFNDTGNLLELWALTSTYTTSAPFFANGVALNAKGAGGLSISTENASGAIRFYSGGSTERMTLSSAGLLTVTNTGDHWVKGSISLGPAQSSSIAAGDLSVARSATTAYINFGSNAAINIERATAQLKVNGAEEFVVGNDWTSGNLALSGTLSGYAVKSYPVLKTSGQYIYFDAQGTYTGYIAYNGGFTDMSDVRIKTEISTISNALTTVMQLRGVNFAWKDGRDDFQNHTGFIAQEVQPIIPEAVAGSDGDGPGILGVNDSALLPWVVEAFKELYAELQLVTAQNVAQQTEIDALKTRLAELN